MRALLVASLIALVSCSKPETLERISADAAALIAYNGALTRLVDLGLIDGSGFIVSRYDGDGTAEHQGDSLIWSGVALASMPCAAARPIADGLRDMVSAQQGGLYRHPSLPESVSLDGAVGFYYGLADRLKRCGDAADWKETALELDAFADENGTAINAASDAKLIPEFTFARDAALSMAGARGKPHGSRLATLEAQVVGWAKAAKAAKASCFRIHVGWLALRTAETAGYSLTAAGKASFCAITDGLSLPIIDHWCGRDGLLSYLDSFQYNQWEYRHQRCPAWETPDGRPGLNTPAVDRLAALRAAYDFSDSQTP